MTALVNKGPLAINIDATNLDKYESGVYDNCNYSDNIDVNHVVALVGYGSNEQDGDYWIVRNSWNTSWGEDGFFRLRRDAK